MSKSSLGVIAFIAGLAAGFAFLVSYESDVVGGSARSFGPGRALAQSSCRAYEVTRLRLQAKDGLVAFGEVTKLPAGWIPLGTSVYSSEILVTRCAQ